MCLQPVHVPIWGENDFCMPMSYANIRVPKHIEFLEMLASKNNHVGIFISLLLLIECKR